MFIKDLYDLITYLAGKGQTGYHSPDRVMDLLHMAQTELFNKYADRFPADKQSVHLLQPFMNFEQLAKVNKIFPFKEGILDGVTLTDGTPLQWQPSHAYDHTLNSRIAAPDKDNPIYTIRDKTGIEVAPATISTIMVYYLKQPEKPVYAFNKQGSQYIFNPTGSVDITWAEPAHPSLIARTLEKLGIKSRESDLVQYSKLQEQHEIKTE